MRTRSGGARTAGAAIAAVLLCAGASACSGGGDDAKDHASDGSSQKSAAPGGSAVQALSAAYEKTSGAKSAKVDMEVSGAGVSERGSGNVTMKGVMAWDPMEMDYTIHSDAKGASGEPQQTRMIWVDNVIYMDMGADAPQQMDGKRWMKMDIKAMAKENGTDKDILDQFTKMTEGADQDPSQQIAMLTKSPDLKMVGTEQMDGVDTRHYKGSVSVESMLKSQRGVDGLDDDYWNKLTEGIKKSGVSAYDMDLWVNDENYPIRVDSDADTKEGPVKSSTHYSDYGVESGVEAPPAKDSVDLMKMLEELRKQGGDSGADGLGGSA
ncbi:hypothetical protein [Streptomyces sp. NPDC050560]|uniref:hypothetical protein n=1 Tax=Streptomyces sp. NPDC050560 TaxID=3365630 RepID=UPI0037B126B7